MMKGERRKLFPPLNNRPLARPSGQKSAKKCGPQGHAAWPGVSAPGRAQRCLFLRNGRAFPISASGLPTAAIEKVPMPWMKMILGFMDVFLSGAACQPRHFVNWRGKIAAPGFQRPGKGKWAHGRSAIDDFPAIGVHDLAGDVAGGITGQKNEAFRHFPRLAGAAQWAV